MRSGIRSTGNPVPITATGQRIELPARLYKFMKGEHANALCQTGVFQIGTLFQYRNAELYRDGVLDTEEGMLHHTEQITKARGDQLTAYTNTGVVAGPEIVFEGLSLKTHVSASDHHIYCFSLSDSWDADIDRDYTACVEIFDVGRFIRGLAQAMERKGLSDGSIAADRVSYTGRDYATENTNGVHSGAVPRNLPFLKPQSFEHQNEYRIVFAPQGAEIHTVRGHNRELRNFCRLHSTRPD